MSGINLHVREVKTALRRGNLSDSFIAGKYSFSPYMACEHACLYCDGRAERYYVEGDFTRDIVVRRNLPDLLAAELPRLREKGFISIGSGISDAYQPVEAEERIMARCAALLARHRRPATLMTKSALAMRDIDLWASVNEASRFVLLVSLTHSTDDTRVVWEPGASTVQERLGMLRGFKEAGCATGVLAMPLLPGITDTEENVRELYRLCVDAGVDFIMPSGLTLRPGRQKDVFLTHLRAQRPELVPLYDDLYREDRPSGMPVRSYGTALAKRLATQAADAGVPFLLPHRVYRDHLHRYDEVNVLLHHMRELYESRGVETAPLAAALSRYMGWLEARKAEYNRHRSWRYEDLDAELADLCGPAVAADGNTIESVTGNGKLAGFLSRVVLERRIFDYVTMRLG